MYYFTIITSVMMPRGDPDETNRPCLRAGCHRYRPAQLQCGRYWSAEAVGTAPGRAGLHISTPGGTDFGLIATDHRAVSKDPCWKQP
jgi:hypothetical protein